MRSTHLLKAIYPPACDTQKLLWPGEAWLDQVEVTSQ